MMDLRTTHVNATNTGHAKENLAVLPLEFSVSIEGRQSVASSPPRTSTGMLVRHLLGIRIFASVVLHLEFYIFSGQICVLNFCPSLEPVVTHVGLTFLYRHHTFLAREKHVMSGFFAESRICLARRIRDKYKSTSSLMLHYPVVDGHRQNLTMRGSSSISHRPSFFYQIGQM